MLSDVEHWSENGRYLVGGNFHASEWPEAGERVGLAQFNPSTSSWEDFGYPTLGSNVRYWVGPDYNWHVTQILEVNLPGYALDDAVVIGGDFEYIFGSAPSGDLTTAADNVAFLNPSDWRFAAEYEETHIRGVIYALAQSPVTAGDGGIYVYASGDFGIDEEGQPGMEWPSVLKCDFSGTYASGYVPLENGGGVNGPFGGPMKTGTLEYARVYGMVATEDHLYVVGDFDQIRTKGGGGFVYDAGGFARFSFASQQWETMGADALNDVGLTIDINWPAAFLGGEFTTVDGGSTPSYHIAQVNFLEAVGAPELWADNPGKLAPVQLEAPRPNPTHGGTRIGYAVPQRMEVDLAIFDVSGRLVRQVVQGLKDAGEHVGDWDGRTERGERAVAGVYLARLSAGDVELTKKIVLVK